MSNRLYIVPTPIGNLEDLTFRALRILKEVDLILAEDTRDSAKLLNHYDILTPMQSYHLFNEHQKVQAFVAQIQSGKSIALISDAGTPAISDPGFLLVRECVNAGIEIECLPGATAFVPALVNSALPCERFIFEGFLPVKKGRQTKLQQLKEQDCTMIFYESPFRLVKTLEQFAELFGNDRKACVCRELTKLYEENKRGTLQELIAHFSQKEVKGEIVLIVAGK
ncbi:MAG: 16S rRNA (cytidine(1402)-2'-O)-methyltransferase [Bacteroidales bacterium]|jgi:16S rRNA (cytidine1402-2'-O)-methyltransferase|nr:16S rRNA (cytidine(1402)-2'-O)-methyltransferase [Bacteroidales bacterium]